MIFELLMLLCFGVSWPISIYKSYKSKTAKGKSIVFMFFILSGYIFGIIYKLFFNFNFIIYFYSINALMVLIDIIISQKNIKNDKAKQ